MIKSQVKIFKITYTIFTSGDNIHGEMDVRARTEPKATGFAKFLLHKEAFKRLGSNTRYAIWIDEVKEVSNE